MEAQRARLLIHQMCGAPAGEKTAVSDLIDGKAWCDIRVVLDQWIKIARMEIIAVARGDSFRPVSRRLKPVFGELKRAQVDLQEVCAVCTESTFVQVLCRQDGREQRRYYLIAEEDLTAIVTLLGLVAEHNRLSNGD